MRVLIVGCGYVGFPLAVELAKQRHEVFGLCRTSRAQAELQAGGITPLIADVAKLETLHGLSSNYDWVVDCVASSGGGETEYRNVYLEGMRNLIDWLAPSRPRKFVYTSSTSVYGQNDGSLVTEMSPTEPSSATSKILVETERALLTAAQEAFPGVILRVAGIYGPDRGYWFKQILKREVTIEGNGERMVNMIHRDDVIGAIIAALISGQPARIYNATDDEPVSLIGFLQWLAARLNRPLPPLAAEDLQAVRKRGITNKRVSNQRLKIELGYRFKYPTYREGYDKEIQRVTGGA
jgi:nucleoside-diphosphate-sugar epimerase